MNDHSQVLGSHGDDDASETRDSSAEELPVEYSNSNVDSMTGMDMMPNKPVSEGDDELDFEEGDQEHQQQEDLDSNLATSNEQSNNVPDSGEDGEVPDSDEEGQVKTSSPVKKAKEDDEELEEGEVKDEDEDEEPRMSEATNVIPEKCKFFSKGICTWGDSCRFLHDLHEGSTRLNRHGQPMTGLNGPRGGYANPVVIPSPAVSAASSWERGFRSAKERIERAKERKENDQDFEDKKLNLSSSSEDLDVYGRRPPPAVREPYPVRDSRRSPSPHSRHHYSASIHHYPRDPLHSSYHDSYSSPDESEYERRQRLAFMAAPRPEEWSEKGRESRSYPEEHSDRPRRVYDHSERRYDEFGNRIRPPPPPGHPAAQDYVPPTTDRFGREKPEEYVDRWRRSPKRTDIPGGDVRYDRRASDLESISGSSTGSGLSGSSLSEGSFDDEKEKRKRRLRNANAKKVALDPAVAAVTGTASTSGMKRIPRLSDRNRGAVPPQRERSPFDEPNHEFRDASRDRFRESVSEKPVRTFDHRPSESEDELEGHRKRGYDDSEASLSKRRKRESGGSRLSSVSSNRSISPPRGQRRPIKDKFVMDITGKVSSFQYDFRSVVH